MATPPNHRQRLEGSNLRGDSESEMWEERRRPTMAHRRGGPGKTRGHPWYHGAGHLWLVADGGLANLEKVRRQVGADLPHDALGAAKLPVRSGQPSCKLHTSTGEEDLQPKARACGRHRRMTPR